VRRRDRAALLATLIGGFALGAALASTGSTYAAWSDSATVSAEAGAGTWDDGPVTPPRPQPPTECGPLSSYSGVVYGTEGDDVIIGLGRRQVLMGLGGDDVIVGGLSGDCVVGGDGDDLLYGGLGRDVVIGDSGTDLCLRLTRRDVLIGCEYGDLAGMPHWSGHWLWSTPTDRPPSR
jgi:predicted ribosomally synthesized peptide with SipW-like signal peptide